jgi:N6-L-threonylcarbamoyladenine synthase
LKEGKEQGWNVHIPALAYCTDNAAMIAIAAHYKYLKEAFCDLSVAPLARMPL